MQIFDMTTKVIINFNNVKVIKKCKDNHLMDFCLIFMCLLKFILINSFLQKSIVDLLCQCKIIWYGENQLPRWMMKWQWYYKDFQRGKCWGGDAIQSAFWDPIWMMWSDLRTLEETSEDVKVVLQDLSNA